MDIRRGKLFNVIITLMELNLADMSDILKEGTSLCTYIALYFRNYTFFLVPTTGSFHRSKLARLFRRHIIC